MSQTESWKMFADHLSSKREDDELNDCSFTFGTDNDDEVIIKANRGLLSVLSPVFKSMFQNGMMKESLDDSSIPIKDADSKSFVLFIEYFYGMNPQITATNIGALCYLAQKYLVDGLQKMCTAFLTKSISVNNIIPILESLHKYHQDKLFENCKVWMTEQASTEEIINLFKSKAFMNTHYMIVNVLLSGFGTNIDATILWECALEWSKTKGNKDNIDQEDEKKDDTKEVSVDNNKWKLIREHFPFYRLPIDVVCAQVLPLNILTHEMALEVLSHKSGGHHRDLAKYCISHKPLLFPSAVNPIFQFGKYKEKFNIQQTNTGEYKVVYTGNDHILFGNIPLEFTMRYKWQIYIDKYDPNPSIYFGIDAENNTSYPGKSNANSCGINADQNRIFFYVNNSSKHTHKPGISTGSQLEMYFDGPQKECSVYMDGSFLYKYTNVPHDKQLYPSFRPRHNSVIYTVKNFRIIS
eukprot:79757_1